MKKQLMLILVAVIVMMTALTGCNGKESTEKDGEKKFKIGILQLTEHAALDAARKGFEDGLKEAGYEDGKNIEITFLNAQADQSNLKIMSEQLVSKKCDLILAIATPAAQAIANETKDIPILTTAVTDLEAAKLVKSNDKPGTNVSGTSDMTPIKEQLELLKTLVPNAKKIGFIYNSSEVNSQLQIDIADKEAKQLGFTTETKTVTETNDVAQNFQALVKDVDAVYIPTDNTLASSMATISKIAKENKIPVITGEENSTKEGGLATVGIDYYELGKQTATMAVDILESNKKVQDMSVQFQENPQITINEEMATAIGITIPQEVKDAMKK